MVHCKLRYLYKSKTVKCEIYKTDIDRDQRSVLGTIVLALHNDQQGNTRLVIRCSHWVLHFSVHSNQLTQYNSCSTTVADKICKDLANDKGSLYVAI